MTEQTAGTACRGPACSFIVAFLAPRINLCGRAALPPLEPRELSSLAIGPLGAIIPEVGGYASAHDRG